MWRPTSEAHSRRHPENVKGDEMSEMYAVSGPAFEAELAYRRELAHRFVRAGDSLTVSVHPARTAIPAGL